MDYWNNKIKNSGTVNYIDNNLEYISQKFRELFFDRIIKKYFKNGLIVDFGLGYGYFLDFLNNKFHISKKQLFGFDIIEKNIQITRKKGFKNIILGDILLFYKKYKDFKFKFIYSIIVLQHILDNDDLDKNLKIVNKILSNGGYFYLIEGFGYNNIIKGFLIKRDKKEFINIMEKNGFKLIEDIELKNGGIYLINRLPNIKNIKDFFIYILYYLSILLNRFKNDKKKKESLNSLLFKKIKNV